MIHTITTTDEQDAALAADLAGSDMLPTAQLQEWIDHRLTARVAAHREVRIANAVQAFTNADRATQERVSEAFAQALGVDLLEANK